MLIYVFGNKIYCPIQEALAIADNEREALEIVNKETKMIGWKLEDTFEIKKGFLFTGDADC